MFVDGLYNPREALFLMGQPSKNKVSNEVLCMPNFIFSSAGTSM
jgi:hypothetical protein